MSQRDFTVYAERRRYHRRIEVVLVFEHPNGRMVAEPVSFKEIGDDIVEQPTFDLSQEQGQRLMDQLWDCGLRPTEGTGSAGAMAAVQAHLADMRTLVFQSRETK
jgi:hypothetical protein